MTFFKICLKSFQIFSSVLKEFLHNQTKYDINWKIKKKISKKLCLCHKIAWIRIRIRIHLKSWIRIRIKLIRIHNSGKNTWKCEPYPVCKMVAGGTYTI